jgi:Alr-MurF fusion protein
MCRLGLSIEQIDEYVHIVKSSGVITIKSIFSHLVASEDPYHDHFTERQAALFVSGATQLEKGLGYPVLKHLCNSPGILRHPHLHFDMVRLGIGLYGFLSEENLKPAVSLKTSFSQVHFLRKGESVSYNRRTIVDRDSCIGTIRVGFADGLKRQLGNGVGEVWARNRRVPILGNICMDMAMVDLTDVTVDDQILNEEVEIFGEHISIFELAKLCHTIPSEILTSVSRRVERVYLDSE